MDSGSLRARECSPTLAHSPAATTSLVRCCAIETSTSSSFLQNKDQVPQGLLPTFCVLSQIISHTLNNSCPTYSIRAAKLKHSQNSVCLFNLLSQQRLWLLWAPGDIWFKRPSRRPQPRPLTEGPRRSYTTPHRPVFSALSLVSQLPGCLSMEGSGWP